MEEPLISVIIPVYKVEKYLPKCIESVIIQSYNNLEIILVDDGSPDNCGNICDEYASKDNRIIVIHKENGGLSDARNAALDVFTGEYVTFVDSDDYIHKDYIVTLYSILKKHKVGISIGTFRLVHENEEFSNQEQICNDEVWSTEETLKNMFLQYKIITMACCCLSKREYWDNIRFPVGKLYEDNGTTYRLYAKAGKIAYTERIIYYYLIRNGSIVNSGFSRRSMDELEMIEECESFIKDKFPGLSIAVLNRKVSSCFHLLFMMNSFDEAPNESKKLISIIKANRLKLIFGRDVNKKVRFACLSTYFGFKFTRILYIKLGMRNRINL